MKPQAKRYLRIAAVCVLVVALGALSAAWYAHGLVKSQLAAQEITMPSATMIQSYRESKIFSAKDAQVLNQFASQQMLTGPQAKAYALYYIMPVARHRAHLAGVPGGMQTFNGIGDVISQRTAALRVEIAELPENSQLTEQEINGLVQQEIANPGTQFQNARDVARFQELRNETFFVANTLTGLLLNVYGWWLLGSIAQVVGLTLAVTGLLLFIASFRKPRRQQLVAELSNPATTP